MEKQNLITQVTEAETIPEIEAVYRQVKEWNAAERLSMDADPAYRPQFVSTKALTEKVLAMREEGKAPPEYRKALTILALREEKFGAGFYSELAEEEGELVENTGFLAFGSLLAIVERSRKAAHHRNMRG